MENKIINLYKQGVTNKELSILFKVHRSTIQRILVKNKVPLKSLAETARKNEILNFKGDIETNNDAYLLGLIWADGNLSRNNIEISLQESDKQLLTDISNYVYGFEKLNYRSSKTFTKNGKTYVAKGQYRFLISSKEVCTKLKTIGLFENKSLVCRYPKITSNFDSHFIRGVFDGDGCIFVSEKYKGTNRVSIVSNNNFCQDLKTVIESYLNINVKIYNKTTVVKALTISGNKQIKLFMNWIYNNHDLKLNRKYEKFKKEYL
jgi:hypothetical protein